MLIANRQRSKLAPFVSYLSHSYLGLIGGFAMNVSLARTMSVEDRGALAVALHGTYLAGTIVGGGMERTLSSTAGVPSFEAGLGIAAYLSRSRAALMLGAGILTALTASIMSSKNAGMVVLLVAVSGVGNGCLSSVKGAALSSGKPSRFGIINLLTQSTLTGAILVLGILGQGNYVAYLTLFAAVYGSLAIYTLSRRTTHTIRSRIDDKTIATTKHLAVGVFSTKVAMRLDRLLLPILSGTDALGRYVVPAGLAEIVVFISTSISEALMPYLRDTVAEGVDQTSQLARRIYCGTASLAIGVSLLTALALSITIGPVFGEAYSPDRYLTVALALGSGALATSQTVGNLLSPLGRSKTVGRVEVLGAITAAVAYLVLIPRLGIFGAAISAALAYSVTAGLQLNALRRALSRGDRPVDAI